MKVLGGQRQVEAEPCVIVLTNVEFIITVTYREMSVLRILELLR